jgi:hypothetical protein
MSSRLPTPLFSINCPLTLLSAFCSIIVIRCCYIVIRFLFKLYNDFLTVAPFLSVTH